MRLNPECIRDILINVEEVTTPRNIFSYPYNSNEKLITYNNDEVLYHLRQCDMSGFFSKAVETFEGVYNVQDLTPEGHSFLATIRSDTVWNGTKQVAKKIGATSLNAFKDIAVGVLSEIIRNTLNP